MEPKPVPSETQSPLLFMGTRPHAVGCCGGPLLRGHAGMAGLGLEADQVEPRGGTRSLTPLRVARPRGALGARSRRGCRGRRALLRTRWGCFFSWKGWGTPCSCPSSAPRNTSRSACLPSSRLGVSPSMVPRGSQDVEAEAKSRGALSCPCPDPVPPPERRLGTTLRPFKHPGARNPPAPLQPWRPVGEGREGQGGLPGVTRSSPLEGGAGCPRQGSGGPSNR